MAPAPSPPNKTSSIAFSQLIRSWGSLNLRVAGVEAALGGPVISGVQVATKVEVGVRWRERWEVEEEGQIPHRKHP